jgi:hypothetical protein
MREVSVPTVCHQILKSLRPHRILKQMSSSWISGFLRGAVEAFGLLEFHMAQVGSRLPTFRDKFIGPISKCEAFREKILHCLPPKMGAIIYPDTFEKTFSGVPEDWD